MKLLKEINKYFCNTYTLLSCPRAQVQIQTSIKTFADTLLISWNTSQRCEPTRLTCIDMCFQIELKQEQ